MKKVRYGIIGAGGMACGHCKCLEAIPDAELVAAADTSDVSINYFRHFLNRPEKLTHAMDKAETYADKETIVKEWELRPASYDGPVKLFSDYRDLLELKEIDALIICTPDNTHVDITVDALEAGKHVLSEKPAATTYEQILKLEDAVAKSDHIYQVGLECRYLPFFEKMHSMITEGAIGQPRMTWCFEFRHPFHQKRDNWIMFQDRTGGVFVEKTCHFFDLMTWFSNSIPKKVHAVAGQDVIKEIYGIKPDIFDNGFVTVEYENGVKGMLALCMFGSGAKPLSVSALGDKGQIEGFFSSQKIEYFKPGEKMQEIDFRKDNQHYHLSHGGGVYFSHLAFIDNIRNKKTPLTDVHTAKWSTLIGLAAEESARKGGEPVTF